MDKKNPFLVHLPGHICCAGLSPLSSAPPGCFFLFANSTEHLKAPLCWGLALVLNLWNGNCSAQLGCTSFKCQCHRVHKLIYHDPAYSALLTTVCSEISLKSQQLLSNHCQNLPIQLCTKSLENRMDPFWNGTQYKLKSRLFSLSEAPLVSCYLGWSFRCQHHKCV